jgi:hypothetical protein
MHKAQFARRATAFGHGDLAFAIKLGLVLVALAFAVQVFVDLFTDALL